MHLHYFCLEKIAALINRRVSGGVLVECFTQNKDELVLGIGSPDDELYVRVACGGSLQFVWPMDDYGKARKNVVSLFPEVCGLTLTKAWALPWDRVLVLDFPEERQLVLKMHGNQSNVVLLERGKVKAIFRKNIEKDLQFTIYDLRFTIGKESAKLETRNPKRENLSRFIGIRNWETEDCKLETEKLRTDFAAVSPVFDRNFVERALKIASQGPTGVALPQTIGDWLDLLVTEARDDIFFVRKKGAKIKFSLLGPGEDLRGKQEENSQEKPEENSVKIEGIQNALGYFLRVWYQIEAYTRHYKAGVQEVSDPVEKLSARLAAFRESLASLLATRNSDEIGSLLMANLHTISKGLEKVELFDFYRDAAIEIKLDPRLNAQQNAARYYEKQKTRKSKAAHLNTMIASHESQIASLQERLNTFVTLPTPEALKLGPQGPDPVAINAMRAFIKEEKIDASAGQPLQKSYPYISFESGGYTIMVGKNAASNDELTFSIAGRDDTWLHARGVSGSHVVIRNSTRKDIPKSVLEYAAALAARYSKAMHEGLVPVIYTLRKYVRKPKGAHPGAVIVEKEKVLLVVPAPIH